MSFGTAVNQGCDCTLLSMQTVVCHEGALEKRESSLLLASQNLFFAAIHAVVMCSDVHAELAKFRSSICY